MPNLLPLAKKYNREKHLGLSRAEVAAAARRFEARCEGWTQADAEAYCLDYWDSVGEEAVKNVQTERNHANAARRVAA